MRGFVLLLLLCVGCAQHLRLNYNSKPIEQDEKIILTVLTEHGIVATDTLTAEEFVQSIKERRSNENASVLPLSGR